MPTKDTINFINVIRNNAFKAGTYYGVDYDFKAISTYVESLSEISKQSIFSDKFWNKYPKYVCWRSHDISNIKAHGRGLSLFVKHISYNRRKYPKTYKSILLNSKGVILNNAIDSFSGKDILKLAKRGVSSSDPRVRKSCARILPISMITGLINDSDYSIRKIVATRISPAARPELFINSESYAVKINAIIASSLDRDIIFSMLQESAKNTNKWYVSKEIVALLDKLDDNDLLFAVDMCGKNAVITDYFKDRLS